MEKNSLCANKGQVGCDQGVSRWLSGKESTCNAGDGGLIPGSGRSLEEGNGYPLQCSCLENSVDRGGRKELDMTE